jgi:hypothetical protein
MLLPVLQLFLLALPIAWAAWTVTKEEIFREVQNYCSEQNRICRGLVVRKFFYVWTCEYCLSHYVTILFLVITQFKLVFDDWRGYLVSGPALVCVANVYVANVYMSLYSRLRVDIRKERATANLVEKAPPNGTGLAEVDPLPRVSS